ncbi:putative RNA-directed DNA polymerase [Helianthus annuus]|nr:putative RNA-directed DNA polymerase [Helianthus annuus]
MEFRDLLEEEEWTLAKNRKINREMDYRKSADIKQRARLKWALEGDENSKFFHAMVNKRKAVNSIHGLNVNGEWCSKPSLIKKQVFSFFRDKFKESCPNRPEVSLSNIKKISEADKIFLVEPFSESEIKAAVSDCGDDRAPGPDGLNFRFIKHFWDLSKEDFRRIFEWFHQSGEVVLDGVISDSQSAFLKGRFILDGPLIVNELISWIKKKKSKAFILKIDFDKAYDNVNWNFVVDILHHMGFHNKWCSWVSGILKSANSSMLVNGSPTFAFKCEKGMRQGDPLSPFLFLVVMEVLSCMLDKAKEVDIVRGISTPGNGPIISHLLYADDAIMMGEWSKNEVVNIVRILRCFYLCSGLKINIDKSNLYGIGVGMMEIGEIANVVGCKPDCPPFKYLGLRVGANMNRVNNWQSVVDIFRSRLASWKAHTLSIGGRVVLCNTLCFRMSKSKSKSKSKSTLTFFDYK